MKILEIKSYRSARVTGGIKFPAGMVEELVESLKKKAGSSYGNHACFQVQDNLNLNPYWVQISDDSVTIGNDIVAEKW